MRDYIGRLKTAVNIKYAISNVYPQLVVDIYFLTEHFYCSRYKVCQQPERAKLLVFFNTTAPVRLQLQVECIC